jgi:competence ComEA-like helix-hairpin-helix protein
MLQQRYGTTLPANCTRQRRRQNLACFQQLALMKRNLARSTRSVTLLIIAALSFSLPACLKQSRERGSATPAANSSPANSATSSESNAPRININTASTGELEKLPGIGRALAARIVEHREKYGPFRRPEHLLMVRGISDKRFRGLRELITTQ